MTTGRCRSRRAGPPAASSPSDAATHRAPAWSTSPSLRGFSTPGTRHHSRASSSRASTRRARPRPPPRRSAAARRPMPAGRRCPLADVLAAVAHVIVNGYSRAPVPAAPYPGRAMTEHPAAPRPLRVLAAMSGGVDSAVAAARAAEAGPRRDRRPPRALREPAVVPHGRARLLHHRGLARRPPRRRRHRHPVLRVGPRRALPRGRRRGLHRRVRGRPHPEPLPALQREDQVRRAAGQGARARLRRGLHRPLRHGRRATTDGTRELHRASDMAKDQSYVLGVLDDRQLAHAMFPLGDTLTTKDEIRAEAERARPGRRQEARQPRHLLHRRRRHPGLPRRPPRQGRGRHRRRVRARSSAPTRARTASPSASARACASAPRPPTASRATSWTSRRWTTR